MQDVPEQPFHTMDSALAPDVIHDEIGPKCDPILERSWHKQGIVATVASLALVAGGVWRDYSVHHELTVFMCIGIGVDCFGIVGLIGYARNRGYFPQKVQPHQLDNVNNGA